MSVESFNTANDTPVILVFTGASGIAYGLRLLECLLQSGRQVYLMASKAAQVVMGMETDLDVPARSKEMEAFFTSHYQAAPGQLQVFGREQWTAPVASGSHRARHMVICPCTTGSLSAIACGNSNTLIERAADVMLKEQRKLILVVRETPLSAIHLENMLKLARLGVTILPANPGFYYQPQKLEDLVDFLVARILDHLDVAHDLLPRWGQD